MTGTTSTAQELDRIGAAEELRIAPLRADGGLRRALPVWVVLTVILAGYLLILIDVSILMAALPTIRHDLGL